MSWLKNLFGLGGTAGAAQEPAAEPETYQGFVIRPAPYASDGQYQTAGSIEKEVAGVTRQHRFVRADRHPSFEDAVAFTRAKGRQIVDEQGERMFD